MITLFGLKGSLHAKEDCVKVRRVGLPLTNGCRLLFSTSAQEEKIKKCFPTTTIKPCYLELLLKFSRARSSFPESQQASDYNDVKPLYQTSSSLLLFFQF